MQQKKIFKDIIIVGVVILSVLPVIVTFSALFTSIFEKMGWYTALQRHIVPIESRMVAVIIRSANIKSSVTPDREDFSLAVFKDGKILPIRLEWNCLGWQSMILLGLTFATGMRGRYTFLSKTETVLIGIIGTFLINLLRMSFIVILAYYWNEFGALIIHDYFASLVALIWMIFFWWFSYAYVLNEKVGIELK